MKKMLNYLFEKLFGWIFEQGENAQPVDLDWEHEMNSNCRRHGGHAYIINCNECYSEASEDDRPERDDDVEDNDND